MASPAGTPTASATSCSGCTLAPCLQLQLGFTPDPSKRLTPKGLLQHPAFTGRLDALPEESPPMRQVHPPPALFCGRHKHPAVTSAVEGAHHGIPVRHR
jgi:hypothetical protein